MRRRNPHHSPYVPPPSAELVRREAEHNARRRVSLIAGIEREAAALGLGPTSRQDRAGETTVLAANGEPIASVRTRLRDDVAYPSLGLETVVATISTGGEWYPGQLALAPIALRRAG